MSSSRRTLDVLMCFTRDRHTLNSRELAELTGLALPTLYRYIAVLKDAGMMVSDDNGRFRLSARVVALAEAAEAADPLIDLANPVMRRLARTTGETVLLARWVNGAATCVHRINSTHRLRTSYEPGQPVPIEHGASSRLLLGGLSKRVQDAVIAEIAETDPDRAAWIRKEVRLASERGWATNTGEAEATESGIWTASAAVKDRDGVVRATLAVPIPIARVSGGQARDRVLEQVIAAAAELSEIVTGFEQ